MGRMTWLRLHWDRAAAWACFALGLVFLLVGYLGISNTGYVAEQLPYLASGAIGGLFLLGFGGMLLLSADLRDEWRKLDRIEEVLTASAGLPSRTPSAGVTAAPLAVAEADAPEPAKASRNGRAATSRVARVRVEPGQQQ
jgi:hypothetical protein